MGKLAEGQDRHNISDTLKQDIFSEMEKFKKLLNLVFKKYRSMVLRLLTCQHH